jgi:hypothetical protein
LNNLKKNFNKTLTLYQKMKIKIKILIIIIIFKTHFHYNKITILIIISINPIITNTAKVHLPPILMNHPPGNTPILQSIINNLNNLNKICKNLIHSESPLTKLLARHLIFPEKWMFKNSKMTPIMKILFALLLILKKLL